MSSGVESRGKTMDIMYSCHGKKSLALPDNRAITLRRLYSVWNSLRKDTALLEKYNETFEEQKRLNVIEPVDERDMVEGTIHYLPHQAVFTPHKNTTKLRIVSDASAHYKDCPSLNDALHRGPVLLPKMYGLLLRFRIGRVALISDVEKAFLQVRLHEVDRDATRCLWLGDHKKPPRQLYVDNLLVTMDTPEDGLRVYSRTKEIFNELKMNLREFASNDRAVMETIPAADRSTEEDSKVLGIRFNRSEDQFQIAGTMPRQEG
ncbi:unnamed protein product [Heligmosomoides polygyrus]|uniref:DUF1758 domain-containing protein n=1 Tax=Heligmosomoides polygyrus TaxID=6339 RepID=A0A183F805_HELPZ|nr:unnamed protein product [Heligmosomoides polygyrus]